MTTITDWLRQPHLPESRALSAFEVALASIVVIGHNVFHVLPNEVPILVILGLASLRLRSGGWSALGFRRPKSWVLILVIALVAAGLRIVLGGVVEGMAAKIWPAPIKPPGGYNEIHGNVLVALKWLAIVWTFAAFGEEISYRGYLVTRSADLGGRSTLAYWVAIVFVSVLFGYGHYYKGPAGIVDSGMAGIILGTAYMVAGRNLWACVFAHGFIDSIGLAAAYFGLAN